MHHNVFGKNLSRSKNEKRRLFSGLAKDVFVRGSIRTTKAKAKAVQPLIDKLITKAKKGTDAAYRRILSILIDGNIAKQVMLDAKDRFSARTSGYTRIIKLGKRMGDASEEVILSLVDAAVAREPVTYEKVEIAKKKEVKKALFEIHGFFGGHFNCLIDT